MIPGYLKKLKRIYSPNPEYVQPPEIVSNEPFLFTSGEIELFSENTLNATKTTDFSQLHGFWK